VPDARVAPFLSVMQGLFFLCLHSCSFSCFLHAQNNACLQLAWSLCRTKNRQTLWVTSTCFQGVFVGVDTGPNELFTEGTFSCMQAETKLC